MPPFTPEQTKQLESWASERDAILNDISAKRTEYDDISKKTSALTETHTDLENRINQAIGRLFEIERLERSRAELTSVELASLREEKAILQTELTGLKNEIAALIPQKNLLVETIANYSDVYERVLNRTSVLDEIVERTVNINNENVAQVNTLVGNLTTSVQSLIDINEENVKKGNYILAEMPKMFFALMKQAPVKKLMMP